MRWRPAFTAASVAFAIVLGGALPWIIYHRAQTFLGWLHDLPESQIRAIEVRQLEVQGIPIAFASDVPADLREFELILHSTKAIDSYQPLIDLDFRLTIMQRAGPDINLELWTDDRLPGYAVLQTSGFSGSRFQNHQLLGWILTRLVSTDPLYRSIFSDTNVDRLSQHLKTHQDLVHSRGRLDPPLLFAAEWARAAGVIDALIQAGAEITETNAEGLTPLMLAAAWNNPDVVMALIRAGSKLDEASAQGWSALAYAARYNSNPEVLRVLVASGAPVNTPVQEGMTPLMVAAMYSDNPQVITSLLSLGADPKLKDSEGRTAYGYAYGNHALDNTAQLSTLKYAQY